MARLYICLFLFSYKLFTLFLFLFGFILIISIYNFSLNPVRFQESVFMLLGSAEDNIIFNIISSSTLLNDIMPSFRVCMDAG